MARRKHKRRRKGYKFTAARRAAALRNLKKGRHKRRRRGGKRRRKGTKRRRKSYGKRRKRKGSKRRKGYGKRKHGGRKRRRHGHRRVKVSKAEARALRIARKLAKSKRYSSSPAPVASKLTPTQRANLARLRKKFEAAKMSGEAAQMARFS
jgi:hypothetical protein